jgi:hypothetical protein
MRARFAAAGVLLCVVAAPQVFARKAAASAKATKAAQAAAAKTRGLGHSCKHTSDCQSRAQRCLHANDANGKATAVGFCVLPCASYDAGTTKVVPGQPAVPADKLTKKDKLPPPPRCPPRFECRTAGAGVPIDMCVKE